MANAYETLYTNMKKKFTVVVNNNEYLLGEYMLEKAKAAKDPEAGTATTERALTVAGGNLPAVRHVAAQGAVVLRSFVHYIGDKMEVKTPPVKDKTMRRFPLRTAIAAMLTAVMTCAVMLGYGLMNIGQAKNETESVRVVDEVDIEEHDDLSSVLLSR